MKRGAALLLGLICGGLGTSCYRDARDPFAGAAPGPRRESGIRAASRALCALVGPRTASPGVYGTDLGYTVGSPESGELSILFGDTWARPSAGCQHPVSPHDDLQAVLPRRRPLALGAGPGQPEGARSCGLLSYGLADPSDPTSWPRSRLFEANSTSSALTPLPSGLLRTPVGAFSDGARTHGIFYRGDPVRCRASADCPEGAACSTATESFGRGIGQCTQRLALVDAAPLSCRNDADCPAGEDCAPLDGGVCLSQAPFAFPEGGAAPGWYVTDPRRAVLRTMVVARAASKQRPADYVVASRLRTNRFQNVAARTVAFFDPEDPARSDYRPGHHTLFVWGRPAFVEQGGAQSLPFLFHVPLRELREGGEFTPRYFAGYGRDGAPRWSLHESEAFPVYGAGTRVTPVAGRRIEWEEPEFDYVNQMSVAFVAPLGRWVMIYGGDVPAFLVTPPAGGDAAAPVHLQPQPGAIHLRAALHPWGPAHRDAPRGEAWSSAEPLLTRIEAARYLACGEGGEDEFAGCASDPDPDGPLQMAAGLGRLSGNPGSQSVLGAAFRCLAGEAVLSAQIELSGNPIGRLYAPNIIAEWTADVTATTSGLSPGERAADIYFNVSTWSPYQVILATARLRGGTARPGPAPVSDAQER